MPNIVGKRKFVKSNVSANNNKVWQYTLYDNGDVLCEWGRVGKSLQSKTKTGGKEFAEKKVAEKIKKGYKEVEVLGSSSSSKIIDNQSLQAIASKQIQHSSDTAKRLIEYLTKVNAHNIYNATGGKITFNADTGSFQTPVGIVSLNNIQHARSLLNILSKAIKRREFDSRATIEAFEEYLMLVPQEVPRKLTVEGVLPSQDAILKQNSLLDGLEASFASAVKCDDSTDEEEQIFQVKLDHNNDSKTFEYVKRKYNQTRNRSHSCRHLKVNKIYDVEIVSMRIAFDDRGKQIGNVRKLWHGTRSANLLSILKSGFVIPPSNASHCTGRLFGNGIYFSDQSTKSLNYAYGYWEGQKDNNCFMFLCDVAMGKVYTPRYGEQRLPKGYNSFWAKPKVSGIRNNEMIIFNTCQMQPVYLIEFSK